MNKLLTFAIFTFTITFNASAKSGTAFTEAAALPLLELHKSVLVPEVCSHDVCAIYSEKIDCEIRGNGTDQAVSNCRLIAYDEANSQELTLDQEQSQQLIDYLIKAGVSKTCVEAHCTLFSSGISCLTYDPTGTPSYKCSVTL